MLIAEDNIQYMRAYQETLKQHTRKFLASSETWLYSRKINLKGMCQYIVSRKFATDLNVLIKDDLVIYYNPSTKNGFALYFETQNSLNLFKLKYGLC